MITIKPQLLDLLEFLSEGAPLVRFPGAES